MLVGALLVIRAIADAAYVYVPQYRFRNDFRLLYGAVVTTFTTATRTSTTRSRRRPLSKASDRASTGRYS